MSAGIVAVSMVCAEVVVIDDGLLLDQVDHAPEVGLRADRHLDRHRLGPRRSTIMSIVRQKSAPVRSILLTKQMRGTLYLSAWRQTVSDCGSTPATASKTTTPPSSTRSERSTSTVKSTWPGVSMMLMRWSFQKQVVAADGDGDAALALLVHPVHRGRAFVDLADLVDAAGVKQDALGRCRLAGVDMGDDADIAGSLERDMCRAIELSSSAISAPPRLLDGQRY